jgi:hypothetical protein
MAAHRRSIAKPSEDEFSGRTDPRQELGWAGAAQRLLPTCTPQPPGSEVDLIRIRTEWPAVMPSDVSSMAGYEARRLPCETWARSMPLMVDYPYVLPRSSALCAHPQAARDAYR